MKHTQFGRKVHLLARAHFVMHPSTGKLAPANAMRQSEIEAIGKGAPTRRDRLKLCAF